MALPEAPVPKPSAAASGQYGNGGGYGGGEKKGIFHRLTWEGGLGFNAPISNSVTYGFNFTIGGGMRFDPHFSTLIEYQFIDDKLPGALIAETDGQATGAHAHIWSFTIDPVYDFLPKATNDFYVTGGGGFYRKVTTFTFPMPTEFCYGYYGCGVGYAPGTVGHFSSNQGGFNVGGGYQHRLGGMYGDSNTTLFAEVRYLDVLSPASKISANGLPPVAVEADTKMIPITFGVRW